MNGARIGSAQLHALALHLSPRDWRVLRSLADHRFLTTSQLQRLHFAQHATPLAGVRACVRVLDRLHDLRAITRLERRIGGLHAGSRAFVWCLDAVGDRLTRQGEAGDVGRRRAFEPTVLFLEHTLAVAELRVRLEEAERDGPIGLEQIQTEPSCWREYVASSGTKVTLKPDLALITTSGTFEDFWFVEVDRGTESIRTLLGKCAQYESYYASGHEQARTGVFPLVVWAMPTAARRDRLRAEIDDARMLSGRLYRVVTSEEVIALITGDSPPPDPDSTPPATSNRERRNL